ncbi:MAG: ribose 5-phosphate isomerase B [Chloroflexi bacterium]|nr:MAG: ribose 5-phosphate isomerase B [Chloroflexota bacterium]
MRIAIGSDHAGYALKQEIIAFLKDKGHRVYDAGPYSAEFCDYPDYAIAVAQMVANKEAELGILICGTGLGMGIVANKINGIRAAVCHDAYTARMSRAHNDANVLCIGARVIGSGVALDVVQVFLETRFSGAERHRRRIAKITALEEARTPS